MKAYIFPLMVSVGVSLGAGAHAQVVEPPPASGTPLVPAQPTASPTASPGQGSGGGGGGLLPSMPNFNPATELFTWNGQTWNVNQNRLFQARFEKYLNAPGQTTDTDKAYQALIHEILDRLAPTRGGAVGVDEAFRLLPKASAFDIDARLCEGIADAVYSAWHAMNNSQRIIAANRSLEAERRQHEWNARVAGRGSDLERPPAGLKGEALEVWIKERQADRDLRVGPYATRLVETLAAIKANQAKKELSELQVKVEFQALIAQLFLQRRFQHVLIATRFYRAVFNDGDTTLRVGEDTKDLFAKSTGSPPTVATIDAMANEALRDVREGVQAYQYLSERNEMESATKRLAEAFVIGEYLPELRTLPREEKRRALDFSQKANQLVSALEVKDYSLAEKLVGELEKTAKDFDTSKPLAAIETARTVSAMHLAKARNAAVSGDRETLETELRSATEIWPRNPALAEVSGKIFDSADVQQRALADLDQLLAQKNHRQIYEDRVRFIAATALYPERQEKLKEVLEAMQTIESAVIRATEIARHGDSAGAWENVEKVFQQYPDDNKLNQMRANLTTQAADFVRTLRTAQELEEKGQVGASLAWYLKAQRLYPASEYGREGVERLVKKVLPDTEAEGTEG